MSNNRYYEEGYRAARNNKPKSDNPYLWLTSPWLEWNRGWNDYKDSSEE